MRTGAWSRARILLILGAVGSTTSWTLSFGDQAFAAGSGKTKPEKSKADMNKNIEREFLVSMNTNLPALDRQELWKKHGAEEVEKVGSTELYLVRVVEGSDVVSFKEELARDKRVRYVEPNLQLRTFPTTGTPGKKSSDR